MSCESTLIWRKANPDKVKLYRHRYYEKNKEKEKAYNRAYNEANSDEVKSKKKAYREANKDKEKAKKKEYRENNPEKIKNSNRQWYFDGIKEGTTMLGWLIKEYEGVSCLDCNNNFPWECMEFDHRPEEIKSFQISRKNSYKTTQENINIVMKEINKCDLVCANCHKIRTANRRRSKCL